MGAEGLSSRAIIGSFYETLENVSLRAWLNEVAMHFGSDQESETYRWLGMSPAMSEWLGTRKPSGLRTNGITIENKLFEASLEVDVDEARRDKTGQIDIRVAELADRAVDHWHSLVSSLVNNGAATVGYDGQFFFDTDHSEGDSGDQDNDITVDISALPVSQHGSTTAPSVDEMAEVIFAGIAQILTFVDDKAEPMNDGAMNFGVMCPLGTNGGLIKAAIPAVGSAVLSEGRTNPLATTDFNISVWPNTRLTATDAIYVFRRDGRAKPFILQSERVEGGGGGDQTALGALRDVRMDAIAEGSEMEILQNKWLFGVKANRNAGYGLWQHACQVQLV
jgi:hypothetical protein